MYNSYHTAKYQYGEMKPTYMTWEAVIRLGSGFSWGGWSTWMVYLSALSMNRQKLENALYDSNSVHDVNV